MARSSLRLVAAVAAAAALLAGCGVSTPAAVVNGTRISEAALTERLDAVLADPTVANGLRGADAEARRRDITRELLGFLIRQEIVDAYAAGHGIAVSAAEVDQALAQTVQQLGGQQVYERELTRRGLTDADVRENIRSALITQRVRQAVATQRLAGTASPTPNDVDRAYNAWFTEQLERADIRVNPRFGVFEVKENTVCRVASTGGAVVCPAAQ